jgi:WG containing repeat
MVRKSLLLVVFTAFSHLLFSQTKPDKIAQLGDRRTELYYFSATSYDSIRFTIRGEKDTVLVEKFFRNGRIKAKTWGKDSSYCFTNCGFLEKKNFQKNKPERYDSTLTFNENGRLEYVKVVEENIALFDIEYDEYGRIERQTNQRQLTKNVRNNIIEDSLGKLYSGSIYSDKSEINDTLYHRNGKPWYIAQSQDYQKYVFQHYYDINGKLVEEYTPFSKQLVPFKDNVDCFYGFKNRQGDTIIPPRFDVYKEINNDFYAVYEGTKCRLMRLDGTFLTTPIMEGVEAMSEYPGLRLLNESEFKWQAHLKALDLKTELNNNKNQYPFNIQFDLPTLYFSFLSGGNYGVLDRKGQLLMTPQYRKPEYYSEDGELFYFMHSDSIGQLIEKGYLNRDGNSLFPLFKSALMLSENNYAEVSTSVYYNTNKDSIYLANKTGELILNQAFNRIEKIENSNLFILSSKPDSNRIRKSGLFDIEKRYWVLDTINFSIDNYNSKNYIVFDLIKKKKSGVINTKGTIVVAAVYDKLISVHGSDDLFIAQKGKSYSFLNVKNAKKRPVYDYLTIGDIEVALDDKPNIMPVFIAKRNGKWGLIDSNDRVLHPFTADFASRMYDMRYHHQPAIFLIEKGRVHSFDANSFPRESDLLPLFEKGRQLFMAHLVDNYETIFFFKPDGQIVIPPQYKLPKSYFIMDGDEQNSISWDIMDEKKQRKIVFTSTGTVINFPFNFELQYSAPWSKIMIVTNENAEIGFKKYGVVDTVGHQLTACENYGVSISEPNKGIYFVRHDKPKEAEKGISGSESIETDSLTETDRNWFMHDVHGVLLNKLPFNYPFTFKDDLSIGMQGDKFNLFKTDGTILPTNDGLIGYRNIRKDDKTGYFYLFQNQGLTTSVSIKKRDGKPLLESGRYDGAGRFYGKYALVSLAGKIGLIDSFGREIIEPQDLRTYNKGNFIDSLDIDNKVLKKQIENLEFDTDGTVKYDISEKIRALPVQFYQENDISVLDLKSNLRNSLWHLLLEKMLDEAVWRVGSIFYDRADYFAEYKMSYFNRKDYEKYKVDTLVGTEKTLSVVFQNSYNKYQFNSFYFKNNRWNDLQINDLLQIQGEKRWQFNELLTRKIKAMKDEEIDCSNASAFIAQVENRFMLTKDGVDFCFDSKKDRGGFAIVSFTWAELEGFLKMRI